MTTPGVLPNNLQTVTVYGDLLTNPGGKPVVGTGTYRSRDSQLRKDIDSGLLLVPDKGSFTISQANLTLPDTGQVLVVGHFEVVCPLGYDPDYEGPADTYIFDLDLTVPVLREPGPYTVLLTADMGPRVDLLRLIDAPTPPVTVPRSGSALLTEQGDVIVPETT